MMKLLRTRALWALALALLLVRVAFACGVVSQRETVVRVAADEPSGVRVAFLGHASFLIESPGHVTAVTDYNGVNIPPSPPDIATMNHAHATHYTDKPDPRIAHVLRGWTEDGGPARIVLTVRDMAVRNIPTSIRNYMTGEDELYGNSIFIFETGGLCIAHLSHLHHTLTADDLATMGPIDVLMVPVDGVFTMNQQDMADVVAEIHPSVVLPMHYFGADVLDRFLALMPDRYDIRRNAGSAITLSRESLPERPTVIVLASPRD